VLPPQSHDPKEWLDYLTQLGEEHFSELSYSSEERIQQAINWGINNHRRYVDGFHLLQLVLHHFVFIRQQIEPWHGLSMDALLIAQEHKDSPMQAEVFGWFGQVFLVRGRSEEARDVLENAMLHVRKIEADAVIVGILIGMFHLQWYESTDETTARYAAKALFHASQLDSGHDRLVSELHTMLAYAYSRIGNMAASLGHGMTALGYGYRTDSRLAKGRATYVLSVSYLASHSYDDAGGIAFLMELAEKCLSLAETFLVNTGLAFADFQIALQHANIMHFRRNFGQALIWYHIALDTAEKLNRTRFIVVAEHGLGIAEMHLGNYQSARKHLLIAYELWSEIKIDYEIANVLHALGVLEVHLNDTEAALSYFGKCRTICEKFPYVESFRVLMAQAQIDIDLLLQ
jgi:tetratricopeptide (TPR) repeat protein